MDAKMRNTRTTWLKKYCRSLAVLAALLVLVLCPMQAKASSEELTPEILKERLEALQEQYPAGKYWNHLRGKENDPEGVTEVPCRTHHYGVTETCNYVVANGGEKSQCWGFADVLSLKLYGNYFEKRSCGQNLETIAPGDVLKYGYTLSGAGHTVTVLGISGDDVYVVDCNSDSQCVIRWWGIVSLEMINQYMNKGAYASWGLNGIYHAPKPLPYPEGYCGLYATYELDAEGTLTVSGKGDLYDHFFEKREDIKKVVLEGGITGVGLRTFANCPNLEEVVLADSVKVLSPKCFYECTALTKINVPADLQKLGNEAFKDNGFDSFELPKGIRSVGTDVFRGCPGFCGNSCHYEKENGTLRIYGSGSIYTRFFMQDNSISKVVMEEGITCVSSGVFYGCKWLSEVVFPDSMETISNEAFRNCKSLAKANVPANLKKIGNMAFYDCVIREFDLQEGKHEVGDVAFKGCPGFVGNFARSTWDGSAYVITGTGDMYDKLEYLEDNSNIYSVLIGEGIRSIGKNSFMGCYHLEYVRLPSTLMSIGENAFCDCEDLTDVECLAYPGTLNWEPKEDGFIADPKKETRMHVPADYLEGYELRFGESANVTFVGDLQESGQAPEIIETGQWSSDPVYYTLYSDGTLVVEGMGNVNSNFCDATQDSKYLLIKNLIIKDRVTGIADGFLRGCKNLKTVTLPEYMEFIGPDVFIGCTSLTDVYCHADVNYFTWMDPEKTCFQDLPGVSFHVCSQDLEAWENRQEMEVAVNFVGDLEPQEDTFDLKKGRCGVNAYYEIGDSGCLTIRGTGKVSDDVFHWGKYYKGYTVLVSLEQLGIEKIVVEEGITEIGYKAFAWTGVTNVSLPDSLKIIGERAFEHCESLAEITIPGGVENIKDYAFNYCKAISEFNCLADPAVLTWGWADDSFKRGSVKTVCHVPSNYLPRYLAEFRGVNVEFVGDLAPALEDITFTQVKAKAETCTREGNVAYYLGSDGQVYSSKDGTLLPDQNGDGKRDLLDVVIPATGHMFEGENSLIWKWEKTGEDFSVSVCRKCMNCDEHRYQVPATVEKNVTTDGVTYTATATLQGTVVSMTRDLKNDYYVTIDGASSRRAYGDRVTACAAAPSEGMAFAGWYEGETLVCNSLEIDFIVCRNIALHAVYVKAEEYVEPAEPILNFDLSERVYDENGNQKLDMTVTWSLSEGMTVKDVGLVRTTDAEAELSLDNEEVKKRSAGIENQSGTYIHHLTLGAVSGAQSAYAKAYLIYDDAQGEEHVIYTDVATSAPMTMTESTGDDAGKTETEGSGDGAGATETEQPAESADDAAQPAEE